MWDLHLINLLPQTQMPLLEVLIKHSLPLLLEVLMVMGDNYLLKLLLQIRMLFLELKVMIFEQCSIPQVPLLKFLHLICILFLLNLLMVVTKFLMEHLAEIEPEGKQQLLNLLRKIKFQLLMVEHSSLPLVHRMLLLMLVQMEPVKHCLSVHDDKELFCLVLMHFQMKMNHLVVAGDDVHSTYHLPMKMNVPDF